jgi:hypothetical protein
MTGNDHTAGSEGSPLEVIEAMVATYPNYGNRHTLAAGAFTQFPSYIGSRDVPTVNGTVCAGARRSVRPPPP